MIRQWIRFHIGFLFVKRQNLLVNQVLDLVFEGPTVLCEVSYIPGVVSARGIRIVLRMKRRRGCREFLWYNSPYVNQIWHQFNIRHHNFINLRAIPKLFLFDLGLCCHSCIVDSDFSEQVLVVDYFPTVDMDMTIVGIKQR